jgi:hypothetical protein
MAGLGVFGGAKSSCMTGGDNHLSPGSYGETSGGLTGGSRRRLRKTKGKARRARVRSSSAGGSRKRKGSRKSKKSGGSRKKSRKHRHSKKCHH